MIEIKLTQGYSAMIDDADFETVSKFNWHVRKDISGNLYATAYVKETKSYIFMHRLLLNVTDTKVLVDHKDWNGLNNQRSNLRLANHSINNKNRRPRTTGYKLNSSFTVDPSNVISVAVGELMSSDEFKLSAKSNSKLRVYAGRIKKDGAKNSAAIELLQQFGYKVIVEKDIPSISKN